MPDPSRTLPPRVEALDWAGLGAHLQATGHALVRGWLSQDECDTLKHGFDDDARFRASIDMARYRFGRGRYRYFGYPLPPLVQALREALYPPLARIANAWQAQLGSPHRFPETHEALRAACQAAGQARPTCLLLRYQPGDFNCLHQDLYGEVFLPLQAVMLLDEPGRDFEGGELVLVEQRPRAQSRAHVLPMRQGDLALIATDAVPRTGARGVHRVRFRHGVATLQRGQRHALGVIFHDAP